MTTRRESLRLMGALAAGSVLPGTATAQAREKIVYAETEGFHWIAPYVASAIDAWGQAGLTTETVVFPTGRNGIDAVLAGRADLMLTGDTRSCDHC